MLRKLHIRVIQEALQYIGAKVLSQIYRISSFGVKAKINIFETFHEISFSDEISGLQIFADKFQAKVIVETII